MTRQLVARLSILAAVVFFSSVRGFGATPDVEFRGSLNGIVVARDGDPTRLERLDWVGSLIGSDWQSSIRGSMPNGVFSYLAFSDYRRIGSVDLQNLLVFTPSSSRFEYLNSIARFSAWGIGIENSAFLSGSSGRSYDQVTATGSAGTFTWRGSAQFGSCPLEFRSASFHAVTTWPSCGMELRTTLTFSCTDSFDHFILTVIYPRVPSLSFGVLETDVVFTLELDLRGKRLKPEIRSRVLNSTACLTPLLELATADDPLGVVGVVFYGFRMQCEFGDSLSVESATSLTQERNSELTGYTEFFESFRLRSLLRGCCGRDGFTEVAVFFEEDAASLMDWGLLSLSMEMPIGKQLKFTLGVEHRPETPQWSIRVGGECLF